MSIVWGAGRSIGRRWPKAEIRNPLSVAEGKAPHYNLLDWAKYTVSDLLEDANLQQNMPMLLIGERPDGVQSAMDEMNAAGVNDGSPSANTLAGVGAISILEKFGA